MIITWLPQAQHKITHVGYWLWHGHLTAVVTGSYPKIYAVTEVGVRFSTELSPRFITEGDDRYVSEVGAKFDEETSHRYIKEN